MRHTAQQKQKLTAGKQPARSHLASGPAGTHGQIFVKCQHLCFFSFRWSSLLIMEGLVFLYIYIWPHFTVSYSRLPQPGGPGPRIFIPQKQGGQLFITSYASQGYGGGIWSRLHTGYRFFSTQSQSHIATDGQSISRCWCRAPEIFITFWQLRSCFCGAPSLRGGGFEYLQRSPVRLRRRRKGNPVPGGITGLPFCWHCWKMNSHGYRRIEPVDEVSAIRSDWLI
jgi:hypothetical protein